MKKEIQLVKRITEKTTCLTIKRSSYHSLQIERCGNTLSIKESYGSRSYIPIVILDISDNDVWVNQEWWDNEAAKREYHEGWERFIRGLKIDDGTLFSRIMRHGLPRMKENVSTDEKRAQRLRDIANGTIKVRDIGEVYKERLRKALIENMLLEN